MTWLDATFEAETTTEGGPSVTITVGWELPPRWKAHRSLALNWMPGENKGWATVHIPEVLIVKEEEL